MEREKLVELTAKQTGVSEGTAAEVLKAAKLIEATDFFGEQRPSVEGVNAKDLTEPVAPTGQSDAVERARSPKTLDQTALDKADAAFGGQDESGQAGPAYTERSGLLA